MTIYKSTIQLLRIPFSINLLPIYLFALYTASPQIIWWKAIIVFFLIHFIFYPASNAYNSYMDRDEGAIAGIKDPPKATRQLYTVSIILDAIGLLLSLLISIPFAIINLILVLLSRAYSWRGIRIKKYAILAFVMVSIAQGGLSFYNMFLGISGLEVFPAWTDIIVRNTVIATLFVASIYPITQIYQHEEDQSDGVQTISILVGIRGTFVLSGLLFISSNVLLFYALEWTEFLLFESFMIFPTVYFLIWAYLCWNDQSKADFKHTMRMAMSASLAMILGFSSILLYNLM